MEKERKEHDEFQSSYFDERADFFAQPIPDIIENRTRKIVAAANLNDKSLILDVGTGCGVLIGHFIACGAKEENVVGVDLSKNMLVEARSRYQKARFWQGDFVDYPGENDSFDTIFFNACFGNLYDQAEAMQKSCQLLKPGGKIVISHPMGEKFVVALHNQESELVPHLLPDRAKLDQWSKQFKLRVEEYLDEPQTYLAILAKQN